MATTLTSRNGRRIPPSENRGKVVKLWVEFISTFDRRPGSRDIAEKKRKMGKYIKDELLTTTGRRNWKKVRIKWDKDDKKPLAYIVKTFIKRRIPGGPNPGDRTPTPPPQSPPPM